MWKFVDIVKIILLRKLFYQKKILICASNINYLYLLKTLFLFQKKKYIFAWNWTHQMKKNKIGQKSIHLYFFAIFLELTFVVFLFVKLTFFDDLFYFLIYLFFDWTVKFTSLFLFWVIRSIIVLVFVGFCFGLKPWVDVAIVSSIVDVLCLLSLLNSFLESFIVNWIVLVLLTIFQ